MSMSRLQIKLGGCCRFNLYCLTTEIYVFQHKIAERGNSRHTQKFMACVVSWLWYSPNAIDTRTRNRYQKPVPENWYRFSAGVSCESVSIFSGTEIWYRVEQCFTRCRKLWPKWRVLIGQTIASCVVCLYKLCCCFIALKWIGGTVV